MDWQEIVLELRHLNLPADGYVVVGGGALAARGIRETGDVDLVVTPNLFEELARTGWHRKEHPNGKPGLRSGPLEAYLDVDCGAAERSTDWLLEHADIIDGVRVVDLETLSAFKASYGRPKDIDDLALIERYRAAR